ncbi:MAG: type 4a pilus biogenesis protein PilO [Gammaproteobacteria bacterium]|nr:type 4a pilus biogenesis protein PilO [Gammaproteobacteria bacterium]
MMFGDLVFTIRYLSRDKRDRIWTLVVASALGLLLLLLVLTSYIFTYVQAMEQNLEAGKRQLLALNLRNELQDNYDEYSRKVDIIYTNMSVRWNQPELVKDIDKLSRVNGVVIKGQNYRQQEEGRGVSTYLVDISAMGDYQGLKAFMNGVRQLRGRTVFDSLKMVSTGQGQQLNLIARIKIFHIEKQ